ncbi:hypothetical protein WJX73_007451 [Symbiochloris irregularis]|uniref:Uncharacterized protein n=1 Tax=Symbiochloris irregularis TaxID=706552 RepID=A0AAW1NNW1_9CHLO
MSDSDEEELASLRAARGGNLSSLRATRDKDPADSSYFADEPTIRSDSRANAEGDEAPGEEEMYHQGLRAHFPMSFGGMKEADPVILEDVHAKALRGKGPKHKGISIQAPASLPSRPPDAEPLDEDQGDEDDDEARYQGFLRNGNGRGLGEQEEEEEGGPYALPISHEVALQGHKKSVSALDIDAAGVRVLSGSRDYELHLYDFNGIKSDMRAFRTLQPQDGYPLLALSWSPTGESFIAVTGSPKVKVYDRDGAEQGESLQGDMYIRDMRNTKGHVSPCTYGQWHPADRFTALTSSEDGTLRTWDTWTMTQRSVIKPTLAKPGRISVTTCRYSRDGAMIAAGCMDGTLQLWDAKGQAGSKAAVGQVLPPKAQLLGRQDWRYISSGGQVAHDAHPRDTEVTSLAFSRDSYTLLSRAADDTLKVWDVRKFKTPVATVNNLPTLFSTTQCSFSPDERLILTGTSADRSGKGGGITFIDRESFEVVHKIAMPTSVTAVLWHDRLNQIFVGTGDNKTGAVHVLYNTTLSEKGVLNSANRVRRTKDPFDFQAPLVIHNPHALPMYREERTNTKRRREKDRQDPQKTQKPDPGATGGLGPGSGGRIGHTGGTLLTQYILKNHGLMRKPEDEDVRAKILRHEGTSEQFKQFTAAYNKTQPQAMYAPEEEEEEEK